MSLPTPARGRAALARAVRARVGIDARSLALYRVGLGAVLLADLLLRSRDLVAFYTDDGVLPRAVLISSFSDPAHLSLHHLSGQAWAQGALFVLAGVAAAALLVGYRSGVATFVSWALLVSLHARNPVILHGGDVLLRMLLFWALFLPLGERWSVDARRRAGARTDGRADDGLHGGTPAPDGGAGDATRGGADDTIRGETGDATLRGPRRRVVGTASAVALLQLVVVYVYNAVAKLSGELWLQGRAIDYVFSLDQFTTFVGDALAAYPVLLHALDYLWLGMLVCSPLLVLLTGYRRAVLAFLFAGMHVGMLLTMRLELFPVTVVTALVLFVPGTVWDDLLPWLSAWGRRRGLDPRAGWAAAARRRLDAALPRIRVDGVPHWVRRVERGAVTVLPVLFFALVLLWFVQPLGVVDLPDEAEAVAHATQVHQQWSLFAPDPPRVDGWYVVPGRLENGSRVDALHRTQVRWDRPPDVASKYPNERWRKYLVNLRRPGFSGHRSHLSAYLCERWNERHETDLIEVTLYFMEQPSRPYADTEPVNRVPLGTYQCG